MSTAFSFVERQMAINVSDLAESGASSGEAGIWGMESPPSILSISSRATEEMSGASVALGGF